MEKSGLGAAAAAALFDGGQALGQLLEGDAVDVLVDHIVQPGPERQSEALVRHGTLVGLAAEAGDGGHAALDGPQDLTGGVVGGGFGQAVAALTAALTLDEAHAGQRSDDLLQIFQTQLLALADLLQRDGGTRGVAGQLGHQPQCIAALGGKFHSGSLLACLPVYHDYPLLESEKTCLLLGTWKYRKVILLEHKISVIIR